MEPVQALDLQSAALFRRIDNGSYALIAASNWSNDAATIITAGDPLLIHLMGSSERLRMENVPHAAPLPKEPLRPRIAIPVWARDELAAIVFYGAHRTGASLDPTEEEQIERIVSAASIAFERLQTNAVHGAILQLSENFAQLKAELQSRGMVEAVAEI
jgi:GAF domain-containing protein